MNDISTLKEEFVLLALCRGSDYAVGIVKKVEEATYGNVILNPTYVYMILNKLERLEYVIAIPDPYKYKNRVISCYMLTNEGMDYIDRICRYRENLYSPLEWFDDKNNVNN